MKSNLLFCRLALLPVAIFFSVTKPAVATHGSGTEISYTHIAGGTYHFRYVIYKECFTLPPPQTVMINANSVSCAVNAIFSLQSMQLSGINITLICPGSIPYCHGGTAPGFEKWVYEGDVVVPGQCEDWIFSITDCCRNAAITTLMNPGGEGAYTEARLNNLNGDNNSPQFTNDLIPYIPIGQNFHYNNGMFDPDGDSLVYDIICARSAPNDCADYLPGYSAQQPLYSVPPLTFDSFTGDLLMHPLGGELGVIVFQIRDYRNGVQMGSVMRDVTLYAFGMNLDNPTLTGMNGTAQQIVYVFPNDTLCFDIFSNDTTPTDTLTITWNQVIPGATFTTAGAPHPTGTFCWIPALNDVRPQPYMFTALVRDDRCELNAACIYSYYIYVTQDSALVFLNAKPVVGSPDFSIFPNPSAGTFTIQTSSRFSQLRIYDLPGRCIMDKKFENAVDLSAQPPGAYFVETITAAGTKSRKVFMKE